MRLTSENLESYKKLERGRSVGGEGAVGVGMGTEVEHEVEHEVVGLDRKCNPHLRTTTFTFLLQMVRP